MLVLDQLLAMKVVAILRGDYRGRWQPLAEALLAGGISAIEVTLNSPDAPQGIAELKKAFAGRALIGAGTALTADDASTALDAGAEFVIAPDTDEAVLQVCQSRGVLMIPGAYTPTEIKRAYRLGAPLVKLFPVPTIDYLKAVRGPLPHIPLMVTGGVTTENAADLLRAGASALGVGGYLADPKLALSEVTARAGRFMAIVGAPSPVHV